VSYGRLTCRVAAVSVLYTYTEHCITASHTHCWFTVVTLYTYSLQHYTVTNIVQSCLHRIGNKEMNEWMDGWMNE